MNRKNLTKVTINISDLINELLINEGYEPLITYPNGRADIEIKSLSHARGIIVSAIATYYNIQINGELEDISYLEQLPQYKGLIVIPNCDLGDIDGL